MIRQAIFLPAFRIGMASLLFLTGAPHWAAAEGPTPFPDPQDEASWPGQGPIRVFPWMTENRDFFWTRRGRDQGAVVFVGDSLTGNWKEGAMAQAFPELLIANRGIGGDVSRGVLFRLNEDVLALNPKAIVLCIGTNDLSARARPQVIASNVSLILDQIREAHPDVPIVLSLLPPRNSKKAPIDSGALLDLNSMLTSIGTGAKNLVVLDLYSAMSTPEGEPDPQYFQSDLLHLNANGQQKWAELLRPAFESLGIK